MGRPLNRSLALVVAAALTVSGCVATEGSRTPTGVGTSEPRPPLSEPTEPPAPLGTVSPTGELEVLVTGLRTPWSIAPLPTGSTLMSERDTGRVLELLPDGAVRVVGSVPGVVPGGEGGLLGIAARDTETPYLYAYLTAANDNRIVRMPLTGAPGTYGLGGVEVLLAGIPKARTHNGGRLAFGPDGMLYATTGDAQQTERAQDRSSLAGKILRLSPDGAVPADNPFADSHVYSLGHRNPQGLVFDRTGQLWAAEFGQNTWDELNRIEPGANYGWPVVEGIGGRSGFTDPVQQWATSEASPSGLGIVGDTLFLAALRGQRLWAIDIDTPGSSTAFFVRELGRIRDAVGVDDDRLLIVTSNTDANGRPGADDDRLIAVSLTPRG
ncbi:PQQ-dependent sugar dehydrogenase [Microcella sp.]|uniref:PQQ-dependent sugar dehydrogenase n=1 Tax=Microcella sp. TaxID=1913979 RepID=UPI0025610D4F|nr:PQQ-dependent sugar dehydrogenase [Microcella sp.]MBX9471901.1 PQQ-dependent sugar dehydrogenase [Microcella sp.]